MKSPPDESSSKMQTGSPQAQEYTYAETLLTYRRFFEHTDNIIIRGGMPPHGSMNPFFFAPLTFLHLLLTIPAGMQGQIIGISPLLPRSSSLLYKRDKTRCESFISLSRHSPHTNTSHSAAAHCSRKFEKRQETFLPSCRFHRSLCYIVMIFS